MINMMIYHDLPIKNKVISQFAAGALQWSHQKDEGPTDCVIFVKIQGSKGKEWGWAKKTAKKKMAIDSFI